MPSKMQLTNIYRCLDIAHDWQEAVSNTRKDPAWGKRRVLTCTQCGSERLELINIYGEVGARSYDYSDEYKAVLSELDKNAKKKQARALRIYNGKAASQTAIKRRHTRSKIIAASHKDADSKR